MKELIDEMSYDLAECHVDYLDDAKLYTDYDTMAQKMFSRGYRKQIEGEWIKQVKVERSGVPLLHYYQCSLCGVYLVKQANYCPNCGAKMKGE